MFCVGVGVDDQLDTLSKHLCCWLDVDWCLALSDTILFYRRHHPVTKFYYSTDNAHSFQSYQLVKNRQQVSLFNVSNFLNWG